jgi:hypothetical protein
MSPAAVANGEPHRSDAHPLTGAFRPCLDPIPEPSIWIRSQVLSQPIQVYPSRIVAASRLLQNISGLAKSSEQSANRRFTDSE